MVRLKERKIQIIGWIESLGKTIIDFLKYSNGKFVSYIHDEKKQHQLNTKRKNNIIKLLVSKFTLKEKLISFLKIVDNEFLTLELKNVSIIKE